MASEIENILKKRETTKGTLDLIRDMDKSLERLLLEQSRTNKDLETSISQSELNFNKMYKTVVSLPKVFDSLIPEENDLNRVEVTNFKDIQPEFKIIETDNNKEINSIKDVLSQTLDKFNSNKIELPQVQSPKVEMLPTVNNEINPNVEVNPTFNPTINPEITPKPTETSIEDNVANITMSVNGIQDDVHKIYELSEDAARVRGKANDFGPEDEKKKGSFLDLNSFGLGSITKMVAGLGKLAAAAAVVTGIIATVLSFVEGWTSDKRVKEITGKSRQDLTAAETGAAVIANFVARMTNWTSSLVKSITGIDFGKLDVKEVYKNLIPIVDSIQKYLDELFDPDKGLLGTVVNGLFRAVDLFSDGNWSDGISALTDGLVALPGRIIDVLGRWIGNLIELLPETLQEEITKIGSNVSDFVGGAAKSVGSFFGFNDEEDKKPEMPKPKNIKNYPANLDITPKQEFNTPKPVTGLRSEGTKSYNQSKKRFEQANSTPVQQQPQQSAPVIINQNNGNKAGITRQTQNPDMTLAFLNSGFADGI